MKTKKIDSSTNPIYKKLLSLTKSKGVVEHGQCLVSGDKITAEVIKNSPKNAFWIFDNEDHPLLQTHPLDQLLLIPQKLLSDLDVVGTHAPLLCIDTPTIGDWDLSSPLKQHEILCALGDPNNLGALVRSARAFGIKKMVLLEECCNPFHPKVVKSSAGACFQTEFVKGPSIKNLSEVKHLLALDGSGKSLSEFIFEGHYRILLGEEGQGLPQNLKAQKISIPMSKDVESLNATVAASILFYELSIS